MSKDEILGIIADHLESNIKELGISLEEYKNASNLDEGDTMDPEDYSQQSEQKDMQYQMQIQLDHATDGLNQLKEYSGKTFTNAKPGALVETDKNWLLIGISIPAIPIGNKELLGISPESPAYAIINGKSEGDSFKLGTQNFTIKGIQ